MNKKERKIMLTASSALKDANALIDDARNILDDILTEENEKMSNLEENFSDTDMYLLIEEISERLENSIDTLESVEGDIKEVIDDIESM